MNPPLHIYLDGEEVQVRLRRNAQARRMVLRVCPTSGEVKLTMPTRARVSAAQKFLNEHLDWIGQERTKAASTPPVGNGERFHYLGIPLQLAYTGQAPRRVRIEEGELRVGGPIDLAPGRLLNWLKREAKARLFEASTRHADMLQVKFNRVSIGDMKSRWGSCSSRGTLRYNWRLLMAPEAVLDYVAAHEVSHLLEMNHSDRFWAHVGTCVPDYGAHRRWLKQHGSSLFAVKL